MSEPEPDRINEKSTMGWVFGWLWMAFAAFNVVDILRHPWDRESAYAGAVLLLISGLVYAISLRPRLRADTDRVLIRGPLRDIEIPWGAVTEIDARDTVRVHTQQRRYHSWVGQVSNRRRSRYSRTAVRQRASDLTDVPRSRGPDPARTSRAATTDEASAHVGPGRTTADYLAERLENMSHRFARESREAGHMQERRRWSWDAAGALVVPAMLLALSFLLP